MRGFVVQCIVRVYTVMYLVHRREVRLMRQWIQDHVSSPVGANLNRVTKLSNLYLCIHWECNEIGARARTRRSCLVVCKTGRYGSARLSRSRCGEIPAKSRLIPTGTRNPSPSYPRESLSRKLISTWIAAWDRAKSPQLVYENLCEENLYTIGGAG